MIEDQIESTESAGSERLAFAEAVAKRVEIRDILLVKSRASRLPTANTSVDGFVLDLSVSTSDIAPDPNLRRLAVFLDFSLRGFVGDEPPAECPVEIEARFLLIYELIGVESFTRSQLAAFAQTNAVFNAWPFWRAYVHDVTGRMGVGPVVVPVFRVSSQAADSASDQGALAGDKPAT